MDKIRELTTVIQSAAGIIGMLKIVYIILQAQNEEDHTQRNRKIRNVLIAVILIETAVYLAAKFNGYWR